MPGAVTSERIAAAPYVAALGVRVEAIEPDAVRVRIPYADANSNPGGVLHGGVAASTIGIAGSLLGTAGAGDGAEARTLDLSVLYLSAAIREDIVAEGRVLRRGKELAYVDVEVRNDAGKAIAKGLVTHRLAPPGPAERDVERPPSVPDPPPGEPSPLARVFTSVPFISRLGLAVARVEGGEAVTRLPFLDGNADADGAVHEGAVAALLDTTGALASWSLVAPDFRGKASTAGLHLSHHGRVRGEALVAHARTLSRRNESFLNVVTVSAVPSGRLVASGSVTYRIVLP